MIKVVCDFFGVIVCHIISLLCYKNITNYKTNLFKWKIVGALIICSLLGYINNSINFNVTRAIIHLFILMFLFFIVFYEDIKKIFVKTVVIYLVACIFELTLSFILIFIKEDVFINSIQENLLVKLFFSTIIMLFTLLFFEIDKIKIFINKTIEKLLKKSDLIINIFLGLFLLEVIYLIFKVTIKSTIDIYIHNLYIFIITLLFFIFFIIQYFKTKKAEEKEVILLDFMSKYEKILDNDRINKHEILNNFLILKSFKNKNTKKYDQVLNDIMKKYENKEKNIFSLYNLPSGLKGLLYYKIYEMKNVKIDALLNISNKILPKLEKIDSKSFMKLCKILGIILDNAKEAAEISDIKKIIIDIYEENKKAIIYIENTIKDKVEIDKIYEKNYSTKDKNRGLGLYIVKETIKDSNEIELKQYINDSNNFVSIISIE